MPLSSKGPRPFTWLIGVAIMYVDPEKSYIGSPCYKNHVPAWRYRVYPNNCITCIRERTGTLDTSEHRQCKCGNPVPASKGGHGHRKWCDECRARYSQVKPIWRQTAPADKVESARARNSALRRFTDTGFAADMFAECWVIQDGKCGLCGTNLDTLVSNHVHADHEPGSNPKRPRGILCRQCNTGWLGRLEKAERAGDCKIINPQLLEWQDNPPMSRSSFARELGWK
jgi:recombination endonuclease VII